MGAPGDDQWQRIDDYALQALVQAQIVAALQRLPAEQRLPVLRQVEADLAGPDHLPHP